MNLGGFFGNFIPVWNARTRNRYGRLLKDDRCGSLSVPGVPSRTTVLVNTGIGDSRPSLRQTVAYRCPMYGDGTARSRSDGTTSFGIPVYEIPLPDVWERPIE